MEYSIVQPPFSLSFWEKDTKEAQAYYDWFLESIPVRISVLEKAIQTTEGYQDKDLNLTPESLKWLGCWFSDQVEVRKRTEHEMKTIYDEAPEWFKQVEIDDWELTERTFSLAFDIGMYFGNVLLKNNPKLQWTMVTKPKKYTHVKQPIIEGLSNMKLNPVAIMITCAYSFIRKNDGPNLLSELYDNWLGVLLP